MILIKFDFETSEISKSQLVVHNLHFDLHCDSQSTCHGWHTHSLLPMRLKSCQCTRLPFLITTQTPKSRTADSESSSFEVAVQLAISLFTFVYQSMSESSCSPTSVSTSVQILFRLFWSESFKCQCGLTIKPLIQVRYHSKNRQSAWVVSSYIDRWQICRKIKCQCSPAGDNLSVWRSSDCSANFQFAFELKGRCLGVNISPLVCWVY